MSAIMSRLNQTTNEPPTDLWDSAKRDNAFLEAIRNPKIKVKKYNI